MFKLTSFLAALALAALPVSSVVIRHDVSAEKYLIEKGHPALVEMRHQGHGMLIAPEWVVTAAHVVFYDYKGKTITVGGKEREIEAVIFHEGYAKPPKGIFKGYSGPSQAYLRGNHDLALIKLKEAVEDVTPIKLYSGSDEVGQRITLQGRGNTGTGITGQIAKSRGVLRQAQNSLSDADSQWLHYQFNKGADALALEGFQGDGDSGGPAIIHKEGTAYLAGLASWDVYDGQIEDFKGSLYGMEAALVRLSYYQGWIKDVMGWPAGKLAANHNKIGAAPESESR